MPKPDLLRGIITLPFVDNVAFVAKLVSQLVQPDGSLPCPYGSNEPQRENGNRAYSVRPIGKPTEAKSSFYATFDA